MLSSTLRQTCRAVLLISASLAAPGEASSLGVPEGASAATQPMQSPADMTLYVELVLNNVASGRIVRTEVRGRDYHVAYADLKDISLPPHVPTQGLVNLSQLSGVEATYQSAKQQLVITVPASWLPLQAIEGGPGRRPTDASVSAGMLLNYDAYLTASGGGAGQVSLWTEGRYFDRWGTVSTTGVYRQAWGRQAPHSAARRNRYLRYDSSFTYVDLDNATVLTAGDVITGASEWSTAVRLGGVSLSRNFATRPDIITYPLPQFAGQAAVPTAVDLLINGNKVATADVGPGPFVFNDIPSVNGAGIATLITRDAVGRDVETSAPFYVATNLLRPGLWDYSVSAGAIRRGYGVRSFAYGPLALSASARMGATGFLTLETHVELAERLRLAGVGINLGLGTHGVINASASGSETNGRTGTQYSVSYVYSSSRMSLAIRHSERSAVYRDLSNYDLAGEHLGRSDPDNLDLTSGLISSRQISSTQANGSLSLGPYGGTISAAYYQGRSSDGTDRKGANLSYMRSLGRLGTMFASANKVFGENSLSAQLQFIIPLGSRRNASAGLSRDASGGFSGRARYSQSTPIDGGLGYNIAYAQGSDREVQADLSMRNSLFEAQGGLQYRRNEGDVRPWLSVQGSIVAMGGAILPAPRISDSFVLVDTQGHANVPILYENQRVGVTNRQGHLLVPWAPSFYSAKYEIDPLGIDDDAQASIVEQHVAVRNRAGARIVFPIERIAAATILLVDQAGQPIKIGTQVQHRESGAMSLIGWNGETYFEALATLNTLDVTLGEGQSCSATFNISSSDGPFRRIGPLTCHPARNEQ